MVVASGVIPYEYVDSAGDKFNWRVSSDSHIAPSAILFEESMYVLKAEYNKIVVDSSSFLPFSTIGQNGEETDGDFLISFSRLAGQFVKYVNQTVSGVFDPNPSGGYLAGLLDAASGSDTMESSGSPGMVYSSDYILTMREVLRQIFQATALNSNADNLEIARDYIRVIKGYNDEHAESGLFIFESGIANKDQDTFSTDGEGVGLISEILADISTLYFHPDSVGGITDRHLDEVRYQPIPYISGVREGNMSAPGVETKDEHDTVPIRPGYFRTNGTFAPRWNDRPDYGNNETTLFGMHLESGMIVWASGGGAGSGTNQYEFGWSNGGDRNQSGVFSSGQTMASGWYKLFLDHDGNSEASGIFHSGQINLQVWPHEKEYAGNANLTAATPAGLVISNSVFVFEQIADNNIPISESGIWYGYPAFPSSKFRELDFYSPHETSGISRFAYSVWANPFFSHVRLSGGSWRSAGWTHDETNNRYIRVHTSGFTSLPQDSSGTYSLWDQVEGINYIDHDFFPSGANGTWPDSTPKEERLTAPEDITDDGSDYIVSAQWIEMSGAGGISNEKFGPSGAFFKVDSSFTPTDVVVPGPGFVTPAVRKIGSEFIGRAINSSIVGWGWVSGQYSVDTITYVGDWRGTYSQALHLMGFDSQVGNIIETSDAGRATMRISDFCEDEDTGTIYAWMLATPSGTSGTLNHRRYIGKVDGGGHPWTIQEIYDVGDGRRIAGTDVLHSHWFQCHEY